MTNNLTMFHLLLGLLALLCNKYYYEMKYEGLVLHFAALIYHQGLYTNYHRCFQVTDNYVFIFK